MHLASPALVLAVQDMDASREFAEKHLGFTVAASADFFVALGHEEHDLRLIFGPLPEGTEPEQFRAMQVGFLVQGIDQHWERLKDQVTIGDPIQTMEGFGERFFQVVDPNGVVYRLIEFVS